MGIMRFEDRAALRQMKLEEQTKRFQTGGMSLEMRRIITRIRNMKFRKA